MESIKIHSQKIKFHYFNSEKSKFKSFICKLFNIIPATPFYVELKFKTDQSLGYGSILAFDNHLRARLIYISEKNEYTCFFFLETGTYQFEYVFNEVCVIGSPYSER